MRPPGHHLPPMSRLGRHIRTAAVITGAAVGIVTVAAVGMNLWVRVKGSGPIYEEAAAIPPRPTAVVPGASVYADGRPSPALKDRLEAALSLYKAGAVKQVLVSGLTEGPHYDEVTAMAQWLMERGVPEDVLLQDARGFRTLDTMIRAAEVYQIEEAVICTQRFHLYRSIFLAEAAGIDAVGLVADTGSYGAGHEIYNAAREFLARARAFLDSYILHTRPRDMDTAPPMGNKGTP